MKTTLNLRPEVKQINCERIQFYFEVIYLSLYFHYTEFSTKALQNLKQCTGSLKVYFNELKTKERRMTCTEPKNITNDGNVGYTLITLNILTLFVAFLPRLFLLTEPSFDHMTCTLTFDRNKLDSMIYRPRSIIYVINYSATKVTVVMFCSLLVKFNILTDTLRGLVKLANDRK
ncbi:hypothetical protein KSF78_0008429 [Schistosoma japonicum]|nr:hypothetical protein KSF78_0008429 [Schistosoma japonicum]